MRHSVKHLSGIAAAMALQGIAWVGTPLPFYGLQPNKVLAHEVHSPADAHVDAHPVDADAHHQDHAHGVLEIPEGKAVPAVDLIIHPDAQRGWNLEIRVDNFAFAPERVNASSYFSEGHAHLYVDGVKLTRLYGSWYYLSDLTPGRHELTVALNSNDHEALVYKDQPIQDTEVIDVPESGI